MDDFEAMLSELEKVKSDLNAALASKNAAIASKDAAIATAAEDLASKDAAIAKTAAKHTYTTKDEEDKEFFRLLPDLQYNSTVQPSVKKSKGKVNKMLHRLSLFRH